MIFKILGTNNQLFTTNVLNWSSENVYGWLGWGTDTTSTILFNLTVNVTDKQPFDIDDTVKISLPIQENSFVVTNLYHLQISDRANGFYFELTSLDKFKNLKIDPSFSSRKTKLDLLIFF